MENNGNKKIDQFDNKVDFKLIKRLMRYAKKYYGMLLICVIMIIAATFVELANPYLMKIGIDDYINGNKKVLLKSDEIIGENEVSYKGNYYTKEKDVFEDVDIHNYSEYGLLKYEGEYYLFKGVLKNDQKVSSVREDGSSVEVILESGEVLDAQGLSKDEYLRFRKPDARGIKKVAVLLMVFLVLGFIFNYIQGYILNHVGQKVIFSIREELFKHIQELSLSFYDKTPVGKIVTRLTNDMMNINQMFTNVLISFLKDIAIIVGIIIAMLSLNFKLGLVSLVTMPFVVVVAYMFRSKARKAQRKVKKKLAMINSTLNENLNGMDIIQTFQLQEKFYGEFDSVNEEHRKASMKELSIYAVFRPIVNILYYIALSSVIWFGGKGIIGGAIEYGVLFAFVKYIENLFNPIFDLTEKFNIMQASMTSIERVFALLDSEIDIKNKVNCKEIDEIKGEIEFQNVWFKYDKDWVLRDVSFKINKGDAVAFVGATGSGKSTIINLIGRMYDIQEGKILIDGVDIKEINKDSLRRRISTVLQDVFMFSGDIKENIRLYDESVSMEDIKEAAKYVNAHGFISKLPNGYDETVVERGATLSTGERQLISFARALAFKPDVLVLDEATSNIDTETEVLIQEAINKIIKEKTSIVVAHRLSTIKHCNKIIVLHKGKIKEMGMHEELLELKGMYHKLYSLQYKEEN